MTKIIYPNDDNKLSIIFPATDCGLTVEQIARKDVPAGKPFLIVEDSELPQEDFMFADAWEADFTNPDGYGIGAEAWFAEQESQQ